MARPQILVIGSTNTDMVVEVPVLPVHGQTVLGGDFRMTPGGKGANQAVAAARAGGAVTFVTALGKDAFGEVNRQRLQREGIDTRFMAIKDGVPSGVALILVDALGENLIAVAPGANGQLLPAELAAADAAFDSALQVILQLEIPLESVEWAVRRAAEAECSVLLNPAPMPPGGLPDAILAQVDVLTPNEGELLAMAPGADSVAAAATHVLTRGPQIVVVTQGKRGASVFTRDESFHLPAYSVDSVDTVGAGDCFSACLGVALAEGHALPQAVRFAAAAAALSTTVPGAQSAMPTREAIEEFLAAHPA